MTLQELAKQTAGVMLEFCKKPRKIIRNQLEIISIATWEQAHARTHTPALQKSSPSLIESELRRASHQACCAKADLQPSCHKSHRLGLLESLLISLRAFASNVGSTDMRLARSLRFGLRLPTLAMDSQSRRPLESTVASAEKACEPEMPLSPLIGARPISTPLR